jgi:hypothetical protein
MLVWNDDSMKKTDFLQCLGQGQGHGKFRCHAWATFNNNRELKVDPFLDVVPILSQISVEWGSKMKTI